MHFRLFTDLVIPLPEIFKFILLTALLIFTASCLISFAGSLQLGPVNLFVINSVLYDSKRAALLVATGGCIPEFIYCALAVYANGFILQAPVLLLAFKIVFILILVVIGFVFLFKKHSVRKTGEETLLNKRSSAGYLSKGFSLAALNPQLLPFWIFVQVYFNSIYFLHVKTIPEQISFILGAGFGAFVLLITFIIIVNKYKTIILTRINTNHYFKVLAILFFLIALQQLTSLIYKS